MKHHTIKAKIAFSALLTCFTSVLVADDELNRPAKSSISDLIKCGNAELQNVDPDSAQNAQPGSIAIGYSTLKEMTTRLHVLLAEAKSKNEPESHQWIENLQSLTAKLDLAVSTRTLVDLFKAIPAIELIQVADETQRPEFIIEADLEIQNVSSTIIHGIARHVVEKSAVVHQDQLSAFVRVFSGRGLMCEPDWEDQRIPIDPAGVFIMDSAGVLAQLKAQPWKRAERFLGGWDVASAFERYGAGGDGLEVLKVKYGMERGVIEARWGELMGWVASEREKAGEEG
jgi:hypothetical protein